MSEKVIYNKDIKGIELTYEGHCFIDLDALFEGEKNPFAADTVKKWWVKYGRLHVELYNGIIIEKCVIHHVVEAQDNLDTKWPTAIMVEDREGNFHRREVHE